MGAQISLDGRHRLWLERDNESAETYASFRVTWIMCNPSTADAELDDQTIRKVRGFTERWADDEVWRLRVVNLWTFRATDVGELNRTPHPLNHRDADDVLANACSWADEIVVAWGSVAERVNGFERRLSEVWSKILDGTGGFAPKCLGTTKAGDPRHPSRPGYDTPLVEWLPVLVVAR